MLHPSGPSVPLSASLPAVHSNNVHCSAMCKSTVHSRTFVHVLISALHWYHLTIRYCSVQSLIVEFDSLRPSLYFQASAEPGDMNYDDWCFLSPPKITSFPRSPPTIKLITLTRSWTGAGFEPGCQKSVTGSPCSKCRCLPSGPGLEELACDQIHRHLPPPSVHSLENTIETDGVKLSTPPADVLSIQFNELHLCCVTLACTLLLLLYQMYVTLWSCCRTLLMCECDTWPCFNPFLLRADGTNQCNHTIKCSSLCNLQLWCEHVFATPLHRFSKKLRSVDKKGPILA